MVTPFPRENLETRINLPSIFLSCRRKSEYPERSYISMERTCKLLKANSNQFNINTNQAVLLKVQQKRTFKWRVAKVLQCLSFQIYSTNAIAWNAPLLLSFNIPNASLVTYSYCVLSPFTCLLFCWCPSLHFILKRLQGFWTRGAALKE